jgi:hypothetical protein
VPSIYFDPKIVIKIKLSYGVIGNTQHSGC